jgi:hypothetical protein
MSEINIMKWFISSPCNSANILFAHLYKAYINLQWISQFGTIHENVREMLNHNILNLNSYRQWLRAYEGRNDVRKSYGKYDCMCARTDRLRQAYISQQRKMSWIEFTIIIVSLNFSTMYIYAWSVVNKGRKVTYAKPSAFELVSNICQTVKQ